MEDDVVTLTCQSCYYVGETVELDGFYYCSSCGEQNLDVVDTGAEEGEGIGIGGIYLASHQRRASAPSQPISAEPISTYTPSQSNLLRNLGLEAKEENVNRSQFDGFDGFDGASPWEPEDFGSKAVSPEDYYKEIRMRYVVGLQVMIELQCEALVKEFKVTPLICGLVGPIWLRFVSKTGVFDDDWADNVINDSEMKREGNIMKFSFLVYFCIYLHYN
ncbi:TATA box-binding protein associated factor RNA polymerase I subunit [Trifolium pratense]|uniref:TATA box-binding protein associated factor RNA polymerase I subunit n=1 Tax=Trifolium pratense TaxID=57577 RepID=A0A2K3M0E0_TRIPR|nr:TATA box-binding protein associated factor RNA polymerase I subunit [Trifolium pratense]